MDQQYQVFPEILWYTQTHTQTDYYNPPPMLGLINSCEVMMAVDTGASITILNESTYLQVATRQQLKPTSTKLSTYTSELLPVLGSILMFMLFISLIV